MSVSLNGYLSFQIFEISNSKIKKYVYRTPETKERAARYENTARAGNVNALVSSTEHTQHTQCVFKIRRAAL